MVHGRIIKNKKPSALQQRTRNSCGTTSVYRHRRPHGSQTAPRAISGSSRPRLLLFSPATPKGIPHPGYTASHQPAALWEAFRCVLIFFNVFIYNVYLFFCMFDSIPSPLQQVNNKPKIFLHNVQMFSWGEKGERKKHPGTLVPGCCENH